VYGTADIGAVSFRAGEREATGVARVGRPQGITPGTAWSCR
jgi:hypothetical protein